MDNTGFRADTVALDVTLAGAELVTLLARRAKLSTDGLLVDRSDGDLRRIKSATCRVYGVLFDVSPSCDLKLTGCCNKSASSGCVCGV
jgi:hypothetical protein